MSLETTVKQPTGSSGSKTSPSDVEVPLRDYIQRVVGGGTPTRGVKAFWDGDIPWASVKDFSDGIFTLLDTEEHVSDKGIAASATNIIPANTPIICTRMAVGRAAITSRPTAINQDVKALFPNQNLDSRFLIHLLALKRPQLEAVAIGSTVKGITLPNLLNIRWHPLPLSEQRRIAEMLDTLDRTIEGTQRVIEKLQAARQGLLHDLLTRGLDEHGQLRDPERHPDQFHDTELGRLPVGWVVQKLSEVTLKIADRDHTTPRYVEHGILMISPTNFFGDEGIDFQNAKQISRRAHEINSRKTDSRPGDVLIHRIGASLGRVRAVTPEMPEFSILHSLALIRPAQSITTLFLKWSLRSHDARMQLGLGTQSIGVPDLGLDKIASVVIPVPPLIEQTRISDVLNTYSMRIDGEENRLNKLQALKRGLMDDLLTGRVRVPVLERQAEDSHPAAAVHTDVAAVTVPDLPVMPPPTSVAPQPRALYRASPGAKPEAMSAWTQQLSEAVQDQQVGVYSHAALDAVLPALLSATATREGIDRVPELLAQAGVRFTVVPHPTGSRANGAAFYLDEPERTQPVVGLSLRSPYLDIFWFNLLHELAHLRLGHRPVADESLEHDPDTDEEREAHAQARQWLIPDAIWQPFLAGGEFSRNRITRLSRQLNRHPAIVAGRLGNDTGDWGRFNQPELRPQVGQELRALADRLKP